MKRTLGELIACLQKNGLLINVSVGTLGDDAALSDVTFDNRTASAGCLFVCKGAAFKETYLINAFEKGALLYVADRVIRADFPHLIVKDIRLAMSKIGAFFFQSDAENVVKIGVTGTKGKTTVSVLLNAILDNDSWIRYNKKSALFSSLYTYDGSERKASQLTTPESIELWRHLSNAGKHALPYAVCEISSQALKYHRVSDLPLKAALFLNIGNDHISDIEHPDFDDYFSAKLKIFSLAEEAYINSETKHFDEIVLYARNAGCSVFTFGFSQTDTLYCHSFTKEKDGTRITVSYDDGRLEDFTVSLFGKHNVENALAAILTAKRLGIPSYVIRSALFDATVEGRGEEFETHDGDLRVIVDYAHNGMSLDALYRYVESTYPNYAVTTVFGCPGRKAKNRREDMGRIAAKHSDLVILTEDDPANESLDTIMAEIAIYLEQGNTPYLIEYDRGQAILLAFEKRFSKTVILICGKGVETEQKRAEGSVFYEGDAFFAKRIIDMYDKEVLPIG